MLRDRLRREVPLLGATDDEIRALHPVAQREAQRLSDTFESLETYCMFIGYPRSGHSVVGSLLDAHENMIIAHELDALRFVDAGFTEPELYYMLIENSRRIAKLDRAWGQYTYAVPGQWQGGFRELKVIGDKKGGLSTARIASDPRCLDRFRRTIRLKLRFIHVIRNPFDNIASMTVKITQNLGEAIKYYFVDHRTNMSIVRTVDEQDILTLYHEDLIADPSAELGRICTYLGVDASQSYLQACVRTVHKTPDKSRFMIEWPDRTLRMVSGELSKHDLLERYSFEE